MEENMQDNLKIIIYMVLESFTILMVQNIQDIIVKIKNKVMENLYLMNKIIILALLLMDIWMVKANFKKEIKLDQEFGIKEN